MHFSMLKCCVAMSLLLVLGTSHALEVGQLTIAPEKVARIKAILQENDVQIKNAFKGEEKLLSEMNAELSKLSAMTDSNARKNAILAYQQKYLARYSAVLSKGNVNLNTVVNKLNTAMPEIRFSLTDKMIIQGKAQITPQNSFVITQEELSMPTTQTVTLGENDFADEKHLGCAVLAGGDVTFTKTSNRTTSFAQAAGGCLNNGYRKLRIKLPARTKAKIDLNGNIRAEAHAFGVGLSATSFASTHIFIANRIVDAFAIAPIAWAASAEEEMTNTTGTTIISNESDVEMTQLIDAFHTNAETVALIVIGGTTSESKVSNFSAKVTYQPLNRRM